MVDEWRILIMFLSITRKLIHSHFWKTRLDHYLKTFSYTHKLATLFPGIPSTVKSNFTNDVSKIKKKKCRHIVHRPNVSTRQVLNTIFPECEISSGQSLSGRDTLNMRRKFLIDSSLYLTTSMEIVEQNYTCESFSLIIDFGRLMAHIGLQEMTIEDVFTDKKFQRTVSSAVLEQCASMSDVVFVDALLLLYRLKITIQNSHVLESQCLHRLESLSLNQTLLIADWWILSGCKSQKYHQKMLEIVRNSLNQLSIDHILQLCYFVSMYQNVPGSFFNQILRRLNEQVENLSWSGIVNVCSAIIKCKEKIEHNDRLLYLIGDHALQNMQDISGHELTIILRSFSRLYFFHNKFLEIAVLHLTEKLNDMTMEMLAHNVFALSRYRVLHQPLMDMVAKIVTEEPAMNLRIKSIWMLLRGFARLNYEPPNANAFFEKCVDLMHQRKQQCKQYPFQFLRALISLAYLNRYYNSLLDVVFHPEFLQRCIKLSPSGVEKHLQLLSTCVEIDNPDFNGQKLRKNYFNVHHAGSLQVSSFMRDFKTEVNEITEMLQSLAGGLEYIKLHCILNHSGYFSTVADIEMHLGENGKPIPVVDEEVSSASKPVTKLAVIVISQSHHLQDSDRLHGAQAMKVRHLRKLGYNVVQIPSSEWNAKLSNNDKRIYLTSKLSLSVD
ncbi:FAST kinase domain-containing protein 5, mitochondrial-like [Anneissia japonica]|uniref:FAST kinase domain-containing protein 5, mitochondrial-like n=1 Tax=Anneissia japonica TaxID=1529436 RepID=UPI00142566A9|nr:FAST kinase domain-containing protein 5, mitochondrial-like [Anneissia japonica]XP_033124663.1 FAST kinase domain-containing protein 5, mitochondrial-like [Anneissia japonica]